MRLLICGDRYWKDYYSILDLVEIYFPDVIIEGEQRGADILAREAAKSLDIPYEGYEANWKRYHYGAGPIRNKQMIEEGKPDLVIAFHSDITESKGTGNMLCQAEDAGIPYAVIEGSFVKK